MEFTYQVPTKCYRGEYDNYYDYKERVVVISADEVLDALAEIIVDEVKNKAMSLEEEQVCIAITKKLIREMEIQSELEDKYRDELKEYFEGYRE